MSPDLIYELDGSNESKSRRTDPVAQHPELSRLVCAAVVSREFCTLLVNNPARALTVGYGAEKFHLTPREREAVLSVHANSLQEFAAQLVAAIEIETVPVLREEGFPLPLEFERVAVGQPSPFRPVAPWAGLG